MDKNKVKVKRVSVLWCLHIKQQTSNLWSSIHEKVKQHWDWVEKEGCLYKKTYN